MNDDQLEDLKQFVAALISQSEQRVKVDLEQIKDELKQEIKAVQNDMAEGFAGVGEAIEETHKQTDDQFRIVDTRLTKLEQQLA